MNAAKQSPPYRFLRAPGTISLFWLGGEKALQLVFSAISVGLIARSLGVSIFGEFQYLLSILFVVSAVGLIGGAEIAAPRLVSCSTTRERHQILGSLFLVRLAAGTAAFSLLFTWSLLQEPTSRQPLLWILGLSLLITEPFNTLRLVREVAQKTRIVTVTRLIVSSVKLAVIYFLYLNEASLTAFVLVYGLESVVVAMFYLCAIREEGFPWSWHPTRAQAIWLLRKGLLIWVGIQALLLIQRMDRLVLNGRLPSEIYGSYTAALGLLDSVWFFGPMAVVALAPSMVYRVMGTGPKPRRFVLIMVSFGVLAALTTLVLAPVLMPLIFGPAFTSSIRMIQVSSLILIPGYAALSLDAILIQRGHYMAVPMKWGIGLLSGGLLILPNLSISWWQGPLASGVAYFISCAVGLFYLTRSHTTGLDQEHVAKASNPADPL